MYKHLTLYLSFLILVEGIIMWSLPGKTPLTVFIGYAIAFCLLIYPIWDVSHIEKIPCLGYVVLICCAFGLWMLAKYGVFGEQRKLLKRYRGIFSELSDPQKDAIRNVHNGTRCGMHGHKEFVNRDPETLRQWIRPELEWVVTQLLKEEEKKTRKKENK
jgi:hypothetical protein